MLALITTVLLSVKSDQLSYDKIMNSFGFNPELLSFPSLSSLPSISNPLKGLTSKLNLEPDEEAPEGASEAESEFDDNVSDIDPNDFTMEMDPSVNTDLDNLVNSYLNQEVPSSSNEQPSIGGASPMKPAHSENSLPPQQASDNEHITSSQLAEMFEHLT